jgi:hypothetical protein
MTVLTPGRLYAALAALVLVIAGARILAVFHVYVQADEFVLLQRAVTTQRTGALVGGGRPGLGTLVLAPFAAACRNAVDTVVQARLLWTVMTAGAAVALVFLIRTVVGPRPWRRAAVVTGVGLWVLSPHVIYYTTQVRTDQPAILFGLLGGVTLLSSRQRIGWAPVAGVLLGVGFLFSQKLLYVGGLVAVLAAGDAFMRGLLLRRELARGALAVCGFLLLVLGYRQVIAHVAAAPTLLPVADGLSQFEYYRASIGWERYRGMLPLLIPQMLTLACLLAMTILWVRDRSRHGRELMVAWAVVGAGTAVALFHAGRFPYFYMVLGLFPAAIGGLIIGPLLERLRTPLHRGLVLAMIWIPLSTFGIGAAGALVGDKPLRQQRASLDWVDRNFPSDAVGYTNWGVFACRAELWPVRFAARLAAALSTEYRAKLTQDLLEAFRNRPVAFMIPPVEPHPEPLQEFWNTRYIHYYGGIHVPGRSIDGGPGWTGTFEVIVPGRYVWRSTGIEPRPLEVDGRRIAAGASIGLDQQRYHSLHLPEGGAGMFVISLPEPPAADTVSFFDYPDLRS